MSIFTPEHFPNKKEIFLVCLVFLLASLSTGIILPILISTSAFPVEIIIVFGCCFLFGMIMFFQGIIQFFYSKWQRKK